MRNLLESSWEKFGPAGRDFVDWTPKPSALPSTDTGSGEALISARAIAIITVATVSLLLIFLVAKGWLSWRRRKQSNLSLTEKLDMSNVIQLEDLQDPERNCELLSSIRRSRREHNRLPSTSTSSQQDENDGVFLMVYLPTLDEPTLTRLARAASTRSRRGVEMFPAQSPGPESGTRDEFLGVGDGGVQIAIEGVKVKDEVFAEKEEIKD